MEKNSSFFKMVKVQIKHGSKAYDVELDPASSVADFRAVLYSVTGEWGRPQRLASRSCAASLHGLRIPSAAIQSAVSAPAEAGASSSPMPPCLHALQLRSPAPACPALSLPFPPSHSATLQACPLTARS